jgi:Spy/CpxP family protein refolding chaperone
MKTFHFRLMIAALAILLGSAIAKSQTAEDAPPPPPMHGHAFGMHEIGFFAKSLNLTDDQQSQMKAILQKERPTVRPLMQQERQIDRQLHQFAEGTYDATKVQALAAQKAQVQVQLTVEQTRIHRELFQVLTPDQQSQWKELEAKREARRQRHMQDAAPAPPAE